MSNIRSNEKGLVSITVTVILMLVISITVLSFAQIIRREQRQALDNQLSSQAFYAAESGINDARRFIATLGTATPPPKTLCGPEGVYTATALPMTIDAATNTSYSCLLINGSPKSLKYDVSTSEASKIIPIRTEGAAIKDLEISWSPSTNNDPLNGCPSRISSNLPAANRWTWMSPTATLWPCKGYGIVRIDITPTNASVTTPLSREPLMANTFTAFLTPTVNGTGSVNYRGGGNINGGDTNQGARPEARCDTTTCKITILGLGGNNYFARISAVYRDAGVSVVAKGNANQDLALTGAQILIDSTGRSQDVLRRIQVRIPLVNDGLHADYAIQSTDSVCKQFTTYPGMPNNTTICP